MKYKFLIVGGLLLLLAAVLVACQPAPAPTQALAPPTNTAVAAPTNTTEAPAATQAATETVQAQATVTIPNLDEWTASPHNDTKAAAFNDWNDTDDKSVPVTCARCHSTSGYQDFLGADGSPANVVDKPAPIGQTIQCVACHNSVADNLSAVTFPSGVEVKDLGPEARCMVCHQGRASKTSVDDAVDKAGLTQDVDKVSPDLKFINIHYFAAAATLYGTEAKGGYEYEGKAYDFKNDHVVGRNTCLGCHNPHTTEVKVDECASCHQGVKTLDDLQNIRMQDSEVDYNGNGDIKEGIAKEMEGMQAMLLQAIQAYAKEKANQPIAYSAESYPYFFKDTNGNGTVDTDEANSDNAYASWTPRLLKAAYNYQVSIKDPGAFAHNAKYIIELLYDSIDDLNASGMTGAVDLSKANRTVSGHFNGSDEQFRHWDEEGALVPGDCAKCHTDTGLPQFLNEAAMASDGVTGRNIANPASNGLNCSTCHSDLSNYARREVQKVKFPSGAVLDIGNPDANLCLACHQGRESMVSVSAAIARSGLKDDQIAGPDNPLRFLNPHYFGAGATLMGDEAKGMVEFSGKEYNGRTLHPAPNNTCVACHDVHTQAVKVDQCAGCHQGVTTVDDVVNTVRKPGDTVDYNGNGNTTEGFGLEIKGMQDALYAALQNYAKATAKQAIVYDPAAYPYFFIDTNENGQVDPDEANSKNAFTNWTPRLLRAAYNLQWVQKDPGQFAHNFYYVDQVLYDTLQDIGGAAAVKGMTRAPFTAPAPAPTTAPAATTAPAGTGTPAAAATTAAPAAGTTPQATPTP